MSNGEWLSRDELAALARRAATFEEPIATPAGFYVAGRHPLPMTIARVEREEIRPGTAWAGKTIRGWTIPDQGFSHLRKATSPKQDPCFLHFEDDSEQLVLLVETAAP